MQYNCSMGTTFRRYAPDQSLLLPPSPRNWLPEGHLVYFISDMPREAADRVVARLAQPVRNYLAKLES